MECYVHRESPAVGACVTCGQFVCEVCRVTIEGRIHCKACLERGQGATPWEQEPALYAGDACTLAEPRVKDLHRELAHVARERTRARGGWRLGQQAHGCIIRPREGVGRAARAARAQQQAGDQAVDIPVQPKLRRQAEKPSASQINVRGVGNLLTTMANCCKPVPGDEIIGFITRGKGVSIHRKDCANIIYKSPSTTR